MPRSGRDQWPEIAKGTGSQQAMGGSGLGLAGEDKRGQDAYARVGGRGNSAQGALLFTDCARVLKMGGYTSVMGSRRQSKLVWNPLFAPISPETEHVQIIVFHHVFQSLPHMLYLHNSHSNLAGNRYPVL